MKNAENLDLVLIKEAVKELQPSIESFFNTKLGNIIVGDFKEVYPDWVKYSTLKYYRKPTFFEKLLAKANISLTQDCAVMAVFEPFDKVYFNLNLAKQISLLKKKKSVAHELAHIASMKEGADNLEEIKYWPFKVELFEGFANYASLGIPEIYKSDQLILDDDDRTKADKEGCLFFFRIGEKLGKSKAIKVFSCPPETKEELANPNLYLINHPEILKL